MFKKGKRDSVVQDVAAVKLHKSHSGRKAVVGQEVHVLTVFHTSRPFFLSSSTWGFDVTGLRFRIIPNKL